MGDSTSQFIMKIKWHGAYRTWHIGIGFPAFALPLLVTSSRDHLSIVLGAASCLLVGQLTFVLPQGGAGRTTERKGESPDAQGGEQVRGGQKRQLESLKQ